MATDLGDIDPEEFQRWTPSAQEEYLRALDAATSARLWYCPDPGRACDGRPHPGADYPHARASQWPPPEDDLAWLVWLMLSGRGSGKTRSAAEYIRKMSAHAPRIALVAATGPDLREIMVEGESGLIRVCERAGVPGRWEPSRRRFTFANGAIATGYSAEEPDRLRGPQHHLGWADEPAHWSNVQDTWDNLRLGMRLGRAPRIVATTTPLPSQWIKETVDDDLTRVTRDSTYANIDNLAPSFAKTVLSRYEGTRLGRQELYGEILEDVEGALWSTALIEDHRVPSTPDNLTRLVIGLDPAGTSTARSDETGIVLLAADDATPPHLYVIADRSGRYTPRAWADQVASLYQAHHADKVIAENNYGGEMVTSTLDNSYPDLPVGYVNSRHGKFIRAEPIHALYEQGRVHHVGTHAELEDQMLAWVPGLGRSPDRLDALVHAAHELIDVIPPSSIAAPILRDTPSSPPARSQPQLPRQSSSHLPGRVYSPQTSLSRRRTSPAIQLAERGVLPRS